VRRQAKLGRSGAADGTLASIPGTSVDSSRPHPCRTDKTPPPPAVTR
jgi:hypothetical protein